MEMVFCIFIIFAIFFGDLYIKNRIEKSSTDGKGNVLAQEGREMPETGKTVWKGRISIRKYHNKGAVLDLGQSRSRIVATLSVVLSLIMTVVFLCSFGQRGNHFLRIGLALLLGGAFSNTYDRLKRKYVVDYFSFNVKWKPLSRIVFNLSDFCILIGAMLIVVGAA